MGRPGREAAHARPGAGWNVGEWSYFTLGFTTTIDLS